MFLEKFRRRSELDPCSRKYNHHHGSLETGLRSHGIVCLLCEAPLSSVPQLENHLTTAHHVSESCVANIIALSGSRAAGDDDDNRDAPEHIHHLSSDCEVQETVPQSTSLGGFSSQHLAASADASASWLPSRRHHSSHYSPYLITSGPEQTSSSHKRTTSHSSSNHRHFQSASSRLTHRDIERIQHFVESNTCNGQDLELLASELGKSVHAIYAWLQANNLPVRAPNGGAFPLVWPHATAKSASVASSDSFPESISPSASNECPTASPCDDSIERQVCQLLGWLVDRVSSAELSSAEAGLCKDRQATYEQYLGKQQGHNGVKQSGGTFLPKQIRTNILPEQQEILMKKFHIDCNPSRQALEQIAEEVGLRKRVVQVWFQNTRARERRSAAARLQSFQASPAAAWFAAVAAAAASNGLASSALTDYGSNMVSTSGEQRLHPPSQDYRNSHGDSASDFIPSKAMKIERSCSSSPPPVKQLWPGGDKSDNAKKSAPPSSSPLDCGESYALDCSMPSSCDSRYLRSQHVRQRAPSFLATGGMSSGTIQNGTGVVRRFRTQMSPLQVRIMKAIFIDYKTPTMPECEALGREIGLQKRVVQVWFQNARAKEKKNPNHIRIELSKLISGPASALFNDNGGSNASGCPLCGVRYDGFSYVQRDHLFSTAHINSLRECFLNSCKQDCFKGDKPEISSVDVARVESGCSSMKLERSSPGTETNAKEATPKVPQQSVGQDLLYQSKLTLPQTAAVYDPDVHGTPLRLLRIPLLGLSHIAKMIQDDASIAQYTDDSSSSSELVRMGYRVYPVSIDVGFVCKPCQLAWPRFRACLTHVEQHHFVSGADEGELPSESDESANSPYRSFILKIEQLLHRCESCGDSFGTLGEFIQHARSTGCGRNKRPANGSAT